MHALLIFPCAPLDLFALVSPFDVLANLVSVRNAFVGIRNKSAFFLVLLALPRRQRTAVQFWNVVVVDALIAMPCALGIYFAALEFRAGEAAMRFVFGNEASFEGRNVFAFLVLVAFPRRQPTALVVDAFILMPCALGIKLAALAFRGGEVARYFLLGI